MVKDIINEMYEQIRTELAKIISEEKEDDIDPMDRDLIERCYKMLEEFNFDE